MLHVFPRSRFRVLALLALLATTVPVALGSTAGAQSGEIGLSKSAEAEVLYGDTSPVSLAASNDTGAWGYNLSFRDVLPPGVSYVPDSVSPADAGEPTILTDQPSPGESTLLWENVSDLAPQNTVTMTYRVAHAGSSDDGVNCAGPTLCVGETYTNSAQAFVNSNPRYVPDFDATTGTPIEGEASYTGTASDTATSTIVPFILEKEEKNSEGELLRGVHDHATPYTLTITNNTVNATHGFSVEDYLPAGLEFLGCGGVDHTSDAPTNPNAPTTPDPEYPGSATLDALADPGECLAPALVETVEIDPDDDGPLEFGVYTHVRWDNLGDLGPNGRLVLTYLAGIPIRENTLFESGSVPATDGAQIANLDNNSGSETYDEQELTNHAEATGTYQGAVFGDGPQTSTASDEFVVSAEDLSIHKTGPGDEVAQGSIIEWQLVVETSEYRFVDDIVITDTLPDGLCPLAEGTDFDTSEPGGRNECDAAAITGTQNPSTPFSSAAPPVENADGSWTLTFDRSETPELSRIDRSGSLTITVPTLVRENYQQDGADETPVVGRDDFDNTVDITGDDFRICVTGDTACTEGGSKIDGDEPDGEPDLDSSASSLAAAYDKIAKFVASPVDEAAPAACTGISAWLADGDDPPPIGAGDRVCWRLRVDFNEGIDTRNPTITDFLPPNTSYEPNSVVVLPANTAAIVDDEPVQAGDTLTWRLGEDAAGDTCAPADEDCYVRPGGIFDVAFSTIVLDDPTAGNAFDLVDNLMKFTGLNTGGQSFPLRDTSTYVFAEPIMALDKTNDVTTALRQGDTVDYSVKVSNTGNKAALDVEVWDSLPPEVGCVDVTAGVPPATCTTVADGPDVLKWVVPSIDPLGDSTVTYTVTLPDAAATGVAAGDRLTNTAGVRSYETDTNTGDRVTYLPDHNIDPTVTPNAERVDDTSSISVVAPTLTKSVTTLTQQAGNDATNAAETSAQATIGETVRYTLVGSVPAETSVYSASIGDTLNGRHSYVKDSGVVTFPDGTTWKESDGAAALPNGYTYSPGPNVSFGLPPAYQNTDQSVAKDFTVSFDVTVDNTGTNSRSSSSIPNSGRFFTDDALGDSVGPVDSNGTSVSIVEPVVTVAKSNNATESVQGGSTVEYTVSVTNSSASRVSTANDLVVTDTLPAGLTSVAPSAISNSGTYAAGPPQTITWNLPSLAPGATQDLTYLVTVDNGVIAGSTYTNQVKVDATSVPAADPQGAERTYSATSSSDVEAVLPPLVKTFDPKVATIGGSSQASVSFTVPANTTYFDGTIIDDLPDGMAFESFDGCSGDAGMCAAVIDLGPRANTPGAGNSRIAWFFDDLAPAAADRKVTLSYTVVVGDAYADDSKVAAGDRLTNSVAAHWNADDQITTDPTEPPAPGGFDRNTPNSTDTVSVVEPKLNIDKDVGGQSGDSDARTADVDETLTYTVTATNATGSSVSAGHDLTITDVVPDGLDVDVDSITGGGGYDTDTRTITWSVPGPVAPGDSVGFTYQAAIGDSAGIAGDATLVNTATLSSYFGVAAAERGDHDGTPASEDERTYRTYGPVDDAVTVTPRFPELTVAKTSTGGATIDSPFTWTVTARNTSSVADAFDVDLVDTLPDHWTYETGSATISVDGTPGTVVANPSVNGPVLTWTDLGNLAPGKSLVLTYRATPGLDARDNDDQINSVTVTGDDADGNDRNADGPYTDVDTDEPTLTGAALGDLVWEDLNGNGVQDGGEPGIKGVAVTLYASDGTTVLDTTTTGDDGEYRFDRLAAGSYVVGFATPATYTPTASLRGSDITKDSDAGAAGRTAVITLAAGQQDVRVDAGFYRLVDLGNFVWDDLNGDGVQDDGEPGLKGITVNLYVEGGTDPIRTGPTGDDGDYLFKDLPPGDYVVEFVVPDGSTVSPVGVGGNRDADSNPDRETGRAAVTLVSNVDDLTLDAGMFTGAAIGDVVFYDLDGDGIQDDNEPGAAGITVELLQNGSPVDGQPAVQTGASGAYGFGSLVPGDYSVRFTAPSGFVFSPTGAGTPATDSDAEPDGNSPEIGTTPATSLTSGETDDTWDAGLVGTGTLGDFVWDDLNGDGIQDGGEPGLKDVTVTLTWAGPDGKLGGDDSDDDVVIGSMPTGDDGAYLFENLPPGTYGVTLTDVPAGYQPTGDLDGVASPSTATATLGAGQNRLDVDFGNQLQADLALTKVVDEAARLSGEQATFRLDVLNNGPASAVGPIRVVDQVPVGLSDIAAAGDGWACDVAGQTVTCTQAGPLAVDGSLPEVVVTATVDGDATSTLNNTATVDSATADHLPDNNTDNAEVDVTPAADLSLDKAHATDAFVVGSTGTYTLQVSNKGPSAAVGTEAKPITVTDTLPEGLVPTTAAGTGWTCDLDGQDVTCTIVGIFADDVALPVISLDVSVEVAAEGGVTNTGVVAPGDTVDPIGDNNTDEDPTDVLPAADLSITKSPNGPFTPGETDSYDLQVTNGGPSADPGPITVVDTYPTELAYSANLTTDDWECDDDADLREVTCTYRPSGPHPVGDLKPLTLEFDVAPDVAAEVEIVNAARVSSPTIDPNPDNDSSDGRTTTKPKADLVVDKRHAGDFRVGTPGSWLLTVGNNGPSTVAGVTTVTDTLPDGIGYIDAVGDGWLCAEADGTVTCASSAAVAPGASFPAITMTVTVGPAAYPEVTNTAKVDAPEGITDTDAGNNSDDDQVTVGPLADLAVTKTHEGDFTVGVDGTFTVDVTNLGSTEDPGPLTVVDTLPAGLTFASGGNEDWSCEATGPTVTCVRTDGLGVDESTSFPITVDVGTEAEGGVTNTVTVSSPTPDPVEDNDGAIDEVVVVPSADLSLTKTHSGNFVVGRAGTWTLQLVNNGPSVSRGPITVSDTVPSGFEVTGAAGEGWNCTVEAQDVTCVLADDLALGDATPVTVDVVPQAGAEGTATNTATVTATTGDPDGDNNSSTDSVEVEAAVDLVLTKRLESDSLVEGASATYLLSLTNNGPSSASQVVLTDELPEGLEYREFTGEGWSCDGPGPIVTCALEGELAAGASTELRLVVRVSGAPGKSVENVASAESNGVESNSADNGDTSGVSGIEAVPPVDPGETPDPDNPAEDAERTATGGTDPSGSTAAADPSTIPDRLPQVDTPGTARLPTGLSNTGATLAPYLVLAFSMMLLGVGLRRGAKRRRG